MCTSNILGLDFPCTRTGRLEWGGSWGAPILCTCLTPVLKSCSHASASREPPMRKPIGDGARRRKSASAAGTQDALS